MGLRLLVVGEKEILATGPCTVLIDRRTLEPRELPLTLGAKYGNGVISRAAFRGDRIVIAGAFTHVNDERRSGIAEIDCEGFTIGDVKNLAAFDQSESR